MPVNPTSSKLNRSVVIDNYDSFTFNLVQYLGELGRDPLVFRNDELKLEELKELKPEGIIISPGPGRPEKTRYFGLSLEILRRVSPEVPTLGVCLGHQGAGFAFGGQVVSASEINHGKTSMVNHDRKGVYQGLPNPFKAARYHSLALSPESIPQELEVTARTPEGEIMGIRHRNHPIYGVQFHPESVLTENGREIIQNFLEISRREK
jgi:anthranilate synthase/aminodeoxychorismate synthase-like glutamine amidotransferase